MGLTNNKGKEKGSMEERRGEETEEERRTYTRAKVDSYTYHIVTIGNGLMDLESNTCHD